MKNFFAIVLVLGVVLGGYSLVMAAEASLKDYPLSRSETI
jgi:hypothetical protein